MRTSKGDFTLVYKGCNTFDIYFALIYLSAIKQWLQHWLLLANVVIDNSCCTLIKGARDVIDAKTSHPAGAHSRRGQTACRAPLHDAMGTSLAEAVRLFVAQSILMRKLPFQPVAVRSKDGTSAYGLLKAYGDPNRRSEERNAWIEYLATESDESVLGPEEVDIHE